MILFMIINHTELGGDVDYVYCGTLVDNLKYDLTWFLEKGSDKRSRISQKNGWYFGG